MTTFTQAILLGADRMSMAPSPPHADLVEAWNSLDWSMAKETALLDAAAIAAAARVAGATATGPIAAVEPAPAESARVTSDQMTAVLRQVLAEEWRGLLPEWLVLCADSKRLVPPYYLPTLFDLVTRREDRALLGATIGQRGFWLARQNPMWGWVEAGNPLPEPTDWETGTEDQRIACLRALRTSQPAEARALAEKTWADDPPEFRIRVLDVLRAGVSATDEPFLGRVLTDRRKEVRTTAQALLAIVEPSALAARMRSRADSLLTLQRGFLTKKLEVALPAAFDPAWKADAIEEKPPAGLGEKAYWAQQILGVVPLAYWARKFGLTSTQLIELARKSSEWSALLIAAWFRSATLHRDSDACVGLMPVALSDPELLGLGVHQTAAIAALLAGCSERDRWELVGTDGAVAWAGLGTLKGRGNEAQTRALLRAIAPTLRDGFNSTGSAGAVLAARHIPPALREDAVRLLTRENGYSKPAETFLAALELRAAMHAAFSTST